MATPWDRAAQGYLETWVPRFVPYHLELVRELVVGPGQRVLVVSAGPGSEALAAARAVGPTGRVHATDRSDAMVAIASEQAKKAGLTNLSSAVADASETAGGPWDAIVCAFGLWQIQEREQTLAAWAGGLSENGKVGIVTWGPPEAEDPFEQMSTLLGELEPEHVMPPARILAERSAMEAMFEKAGLALVRLTVVRHTLTFPTAESFVRALREACTWRRVWETLGDARLARVATAFYERVGGPDAPLTFQPPATIAIAARPGAQVELAHRPSVRAPKREG